MPGHVFNQAGQALDSIYVILAGQVVIHRIIVTHSKYQNIADDYMTQVARIEEAQWFGVSSIKFVTNGNTDNAENDTSHTANRNTKPLNQSYKRGEDLKSTNDIVTAEAKITSNFYTDVELESHVAVTKVKVLVIPSSILQQLSKRLLCCFANDYRMRNSWRSTVAENADFCRRLDILRTMSTTTAVKSAINNIMSGFEKNPSRPSSPRIVKNLVEASMRKHHENPIPSVYDPIQETRLQKEKKKVYGHPNQPGDFTKTLNGSFGFKCSKINDSTGENVPKRDVTQFMNRNPSPRKVKFKSLPEDYQELLVKNLKAPKLHQLDAEETDIKMQKMWKYNWRVGKPFKQKKEAMAFPENVYKDIYKLQYKRKTLLEGKYNF